MSTNMFTRRRALPWLAGALLICAVGALVVSRAVHSSKAQKARPDLQRIIDGLVSGRDRIAPGVSAYVAGPHGTWSGSAGIANVKTGEPMRTDTRVRLESVGKTWTAVLILQLAAEGKLRLDDTVAHQLPGLLPYGNRITIRQLLDHTSGIVDTNDITHDPSSYLGQIENRALRGRLEAVARRIAADPGYEFPARLWVEFAAAVPLEYRPATTFHYSNIGYIVAGLVAERASGTSLETLVRRRIVEPLHLESSAYDPHAAIAGGHAHGYSVAPNGRLRDTTTWTQGLGANGGIVSDAADEAHFLQALMRGELLGHAELAALEQPSAQSNYGLGVGVDASGCAGTVYAHNGGGDGFETNVYVSGSGDRVAVLLLNGRTTDSHGDAIALTAMQLLFCNA